MSDRALVAATGNTHKLAELRRLLGDVRVLGLGDPGAPGPVPVDETGSTFADNAALKALALSRLTGLPVIADDSGLCVDALGGQPGVHSARYGGPGLDDRQRYELLLARMAHVPDPARSAHYEAAVALARDGRILALREGRVDGLVLRRPRGGGGFGYDPVFLVEDLGLTMAELTPAQKDAVSHRARAVAGLAGPLEEALGAFVHPPGQNAGPNANCQRE